MRFFKTKLWFVAAVMMLATSCGTVEEYVLLNDLDVDTYYKMQPMPELHIKRQPAHRGDTQAAYACRDV